ncbi:hypothetical protein A2U01_0114898, partial [Trifolium medium]|nr:hypothetical protein [Trifolium medium]
MQTAQIYSSRLCLAQTSLRLAEEAGASAPPAPKHRASRLAQGAVPELF